MRIGLFGGSFNPAHEGHRLVALECLKRLALDRVWILVIARQSAEGPLRTGPARRARRSGAPQLMDDPQLEVTGFEAAHGFTYTWETLDFLTRAHPRTDFVWIMGADSLQTLSTAGSAGTISRG